MAARDQAGPILNGLPSQLPDIDPDETQEWLDSLDGAIEEGGRTRARYLMLKLIQRAREKQLGVPSLITGRLRSVATGVPSSCEWCLRCNPALRMRPASRRPASNATGDTPTHQ